MERELFFKSEKWTLYSLIQDTIPKHNPQINTKFSLKHKTKKKKKKNLVCSVGKHLFIPVIGQVLGM